MPTGGHRAGDHRQLLGPGDSPWLSASKEIGVSALQVIIHEDDSANNSKGAWKRSFPQSHLCRALHLNSQLDYSLVRLFSKEFREAMAVLRTHGNCEIIHVLKSYVYVNLLCSN